MIAVWLELACLEWHHASFRGVLGVCALTVIWLAHWIRLCSWAVAPLELYTMESMIIFLSLTECYTILMPIHHSGLKRSSPIHVHIFHITYLSVRKFMLWLKQDDQSHHYLCHYVQVCSSWKGYAYVLWHQSNRFDKIQELEWSQRCKTNPCKTNKTSIQLSHTDIYWHLMQYSPSQMKQVFTCHCCFLKVV